MKSHGSVDIGVVEEKDETGKSQFVPYIKITETYDGETTEIQFDCDHEFDDEGMAFEFCKGIRDIFHSPKSNEKEYPPTPSLTVTKISDDQH